MSNKAIIKVERGLLVNKYAKVIPSQWEGMEVDIVRPDNPTVQVVMSAPEEVTAGSDFSARLEVEEVVDFDSFQVDVLYDPIQLSIDDVTEGNINSIAIPIDIWAFKPANVQGRVRILGNVPGVPGITGSGYLAEIHFHAN